MRNLAWKTLNAAYGRNPQQIESPKVGCDGSTRSSREPVSWRLKRGTGDRNRDGHNFARQNKLT